MQLKPRPTGVTVLAILAILAGVSSLLFGVLLLQVSALASALLLGNGIFDFVLAVGYLSGNGWAWVLGIVFGAINIVGSIVEIAAGISNNILGIILSMITIYYLTRLHVKTYFGRGPSMASANLSLPIVTPISTGSDSTVFPRGMNCKQCGILLPAGATFCRDCGTIQ